MPAYTFRGVYPRGHKGLRPLDPEPVRYEWRPMRGPKGKYRGQFERVAVYPDGRVVRFSQGGGGIQTYFPEKRGNDLLTNLVAMIKELRTAEECHTMMVAVTRHIKTLSAKAARRRRRVIRKGGKTAARRTRRAK